MIHTKELFRDLNIEINEFYKHVVENQENSTVHLITKSNHILMLYNLVESIINSLIKELFDYINDSKLLFSQLKYPIRILFMEQIVRKENNSSKRDQKNKIYESLKDLNEFVDNNKVIKFDIDYRKPFIVNGNIDAYKINEIIKTLDLCIKPILNEHIISILSEIKSIRNDLAHGNESFQKKAMKYSIKDIENYNKVILGFINEVIKSFEDYFQKKDFLL